MKKLLLGAAAALACATQVHAQSAADAWPSRPVRVIVPFTAGSFTDTAARAMSRELSASLGQQFVVENRGGAGSTIGTDVAAKAAPDGYTFVVTDNSFAVSSALYASLPYDPKKDIVQVAELAEAPAVLVGRTELPQKDLKSVIAAAKAQPDKLTFGSGGQGSSAHLAMEELLLQTGSRMVHVPYKGIAAAILDVVAQRIDVAIGSVGSTVQFIKDGRVRGLALSGKTRHPMFPQVPTFAEAGFPDYGVMYWFGVMAPAGIPPAILDKMQAAVQQATRAPKLREVFEAAGVQPSGTGGAEFGRRVADETQMWKRVIEKAGIKPE
ncbi:Bug family tripartite tricarboxylate transporter substrate binding protein [Pigmentiphaga humi]|nr:tripartite tricarboxylate transporter substrate binding protein [Pigmentiphaga humi]